MDSATIYCPHCGRKLNCPTNTLGRKIRCPSCAEPFLAAREEEETYEFASEETPPAAPKSTGQSPSGVLEDLARNEGLAEGRASEGVTCPNCRESLPQWAKVCVQCGFDVRTGRLVESGNTSILLPEVEEQENARAPAKRDASESSGGGRQRIPATVLAVILVVGLAVLSNILATVAAFGGQQPTSEFGITNPCCLPMILIVQVLIIWGLARGHRLAWQWCRVIGILVMIGGFALLALQGDPSRIVKNPDIGVLFFFAKLAVILGCLSMPSAKKHFNLYCPECGRKGKAADLLYRMSKCRRCDMTW